MYAKSSLEGAQTNCDNNSSILQKVKLAPQSSRPTRQDSSTNDTSFAIPSDLQQYLTTTAHPHEVYSILKNSRERRLRLLLRRFTNQVQYGCKNPYCDTQTCFSYRKRHSSVPVRPYSDVVARSLAWRCVEEYGNEGSSRNGTNSRTGLDQRRRAKANAPLGTKSDGLCWNPPVIPWYESPSDFERRRASIQNKTSPERQPSRERHKSLELLERASPNECHRNVKQSPHMAHKQNGAPIVNKVRNKSLNGGIEQEVVCETTYASSSIPSSRRTVKFEVDDSVPRPSQQQQPKDTASFSQVLYDTSGIVRLDQVLPRDDIVKQRQSNNGAYSDDGKTDQHIRTAYSPRRLTALRVDTLRLLPINAIKWLVQAVSHDDGQYVSFQNGSDSNSTRLIDFATQSLHYCLSHPLRLIESVQRWARPNVPTTNSECDSPAHGTSGLSDTHHEQSGNRGVNCTSKLPAQPALLPSADDARLAFSLLSQIESSGEIMSHVFAALQHAYILPPALTSTRVRNQKFMPETSPLAAASIGTRASSADEKETDTPASFLDDEQVAFLCIVVLFALGFLPLETRYSSGRIDDWPVYLQLRNTAQVFPHGHTDRGVRWRRKYLADIDNDEDPEALRLLKSFANVISHRMAVQETVCTTKGLMAPLVRPKPIIEVFIGHLSHIQETGERTNRFAAIYLIDLMSTLLLKIWDRQPIINRTSPIGGALQLLAGLYRNRTKFSLSAESFAFDFIPNSFNDLKMPVDWLGFREDNKQTHILSFSFLFNTSSLVKYFRAINIETMRKSHEYAATNYADARHFLKLKPIRVYGAREVLVDMRPHMARYFVVTIRRAHMIEDAINQIWRRQRQELMRPLKIILGKEEGEDGLDHGGVQQEFFRVVFGMMLDMDYGMFTVDDRTRMTWFQPDSLEPLYKYEALGILMSLAVYNAVTLPVTFPLAFYRKLLGLKVKHLAHIEDGWPELARGLKTLRDWDDGDVGDVIARTYEFAYHAFGTDITVDMTKAERDDASSSTRRNASKEKLKQASFDPSLFDKGGYIAKPDSTPGSPRLSFSILHLPDGEVLEYPTSLEISELSSKDVEDHVRSESSPAEAPLVTNANRDRYIKDYIFWLTNKSIAPQYEAFAKGFHTCLDSTALSIFTPEALKSVVEGQTEIDIDGLQATTTYEDYMPSEDTIVDFWSIVRDFSPRQHKQLLEFVTASDRIPVSGIQSVTFLIQKNGDGDERLPSSSTCYGRLLLPKYGSKKVMREKLEKAIENSIGFGSL